MDALDGTIETINQLEQQLQQYKQQIDDVRQELKNLLEFALYENYQYCNTEKHVERILSKLKERDEK